MVTRWSQLNQVNQRYTGTEKARMALSLVHYQVNPQFNRSSLIQRLNMETIHYLALLSEGKMES